MKNQLLPLLGTLGGVALDQGSKYLFGGGSVPGMNTTTFTDLLGGATGSRTEIVTVPQYVKSRKRSLTLGKKQSWKARVDRQLRLSTAKLSCRWQSLATFDDGWGSIPLSLEYQGGTQAQPLRTYFPVYVFNLSCFPSSLNGVLGNTQIKPIVGYRLYRTYDGTKATYLWERIGGINNGVAGAPAPVPPTALQHGYQWQITDNTFIDTENRPIDEWSRNWTNIRMMFTGANKRPSKIGTAVIRFQDESYGPEREYLATTGGLTTIDVRDSDPVDVNQNEEKTQYYDSWLISKCSHPLASTKQEYKQKPIYWYSHDTVLLGQETTISNDRNGLQCSKDMFLKGGEMYKGVTVSADMIGQAKTMQNENNQTSIEPGATTAVANGQYYNDDKAHDISFPMDNAYKDKYLMVYSNNYNRPYESVEGFDSQYPYQGDIIRFHDFATRDLKDEYQTVETVRASDRNASFDIRIDSSFSFNL